MHKNVLCVIDIANPKLSGVLLQRAAALSTLDQAQLYVLTVAPDLTGGLAASFLNQGPLKELFDQATKMTHDFVQQTAPGVKIAKHFSTLGDVEPEAIKAADEIEADLIILGADRSELARSLAAGEAELSGEPPSVYIVRG